MKKTIRRKGGGLSRVKITEPAEEEEEE